MPPITRFEDLKAWQISRLLANKIFDLSGSGNLSKSYSIRNQLERAAVSVMANIAEGFERRSGKDFARFLVIAKASAAEVRSLLYLAVDRKLISAADGNLAMELVDRVCALSSRLRAVLLKADRKTI